MGLIFVMYEGDFHELPPGDWGEAFMISQWTHMTLRDRYKLTESLTICPSAQRAFANNSPYPSDATFQRKWTGSNSEAKMTYHYFAGNGQRPDSASGTKINGWLVSGGYFPYWPRGYYPYLTFAKAAKRSIDMPYLLDWRITRTPASTSTSRRSRITPCAGTRTRRRGSTCCSTDNHVEWQKIGGQSWRIGQDFYEGFWWSPTYPPPG
jgi:hypothetical protein